MKFKKFLALSLAAAMMTTGIPGVGMLDGAVNVMAATPTTPGDAGDTIDVGDANADSDSDGKLDSNNYVSFKDSDGKEVNVLVYYGDDNATPSGISKTVTYNGKDQKPSEKNTVVTINNGQGGTETKLVRNTDYTISYYKAVKNGTNKVLGDKVSSIVDAGEYFVAITGKGKYSGTIYGDFSVGKLDLNANASNLEVKGATLGYTGKNIAPTVGSVVYDDSTIKLTLSPSDYTLEYEAGGTAQKAPGTYNLKLTGKGNYENSVDVTNDNVTGLTTSIVKKLSAGDAFLAIDKLNSGAPNFKIVGSSGSYELKPKGTIHASDYNVIVKVNDEEVSDADSITLADEDKISIEGTGSAFTGSISMTYNASNYTYKTPITKNDITILSNSIYTGDEIKPLVNVNVGGTVLTQGKDYDVFYTNNIDKGTSSASVTVVGKGAYYGVATDTFSILANNLITGTVASIPATVYTGQSQPLKASALTVTDSTGKLISSDEIDEASIRYYEIDKDSDDDLISDENGLMGYKVDLNDALLAPTHAGTYVVEIPFSSTGNYANASKLYQTYEIKPASITTGYQFATGYNDKKDNFKKEYTGKIVSFASGEVSLTQLDAAGELTSNSLTFGSEFTVETPKDARDVGEYSGVVKGTGDYTGEIPFTFNIVKTIGDADVAFNVEENKVNNKVTYVYTPVTLVKEKVSNSLLAADTDYTVSYYACKPSSQDKADFQYKGTNYAFVGGNATSFTLGEHYVAVINGAGDYEGTKYVVFQVPDVSEATSLKDASITFTKDYVAIDKYSDEYTGKPISVGATGSSNAIAVRVGNKLLSEGTDFEVVYNNNINVSKEAEVIIVGKGNYYGTVSAKFEITQKAMSNSKITVKTGAKQVESYCYTGKPLNASISVSDNDLGNLVEGVDYEVSYANIVPDGSNAKKDATGAYIKGDAIDLADITEVGSYLVVIKGIGNYTGEVTQLVKIDKVNLSSSVTIKGNDMVATGEEITPAFTFINKEDGSEFSIDVSNYTLKLYADKGCKEPLDSITEVGTYYAKLKGTNNATGTSAAIEFNVVEGKDIADADVTVLDSTENPKLLVVLDGKVLEADTDYTVEYVVGEDGKTGTAIVTGAGKYAGTVSTTYEIKKDIVALSKASIKLSKTSYGYNGKAKKPGVTVKVDGVKVDPSEYTVSYSNNKNAGTGKVTITAKDDSEVIKGSKTMTITIAKASNKVTASNVTKSYKVKTLKAKKATFKLSAKAKAGKISYKKVSSGKKITVSKNGTVTVAKGLKKGTYKVKVKVTAASSTNYKAASKTMTVTVKVK